MRKLFVAFLVLSVVSIPNSQTVKYFTNKSESTASHTIYHPLKTVTSTSKNIDGTLTIIDSTFSEVTISSEVTSFKCGIKFIDDWAIKIVEYNKYSRVTFTSTTLTPRQDGYLVTGIMDFHGVKKEIEFPVKTSIKNDMAYASGSLELTPTDFNIKLPRPFGISIENKLTVVFNLSTRIK